MNGILTIAKKEVKSYFTSPTAYVVLAAFLLLSGWFFISPLFLINQATLSSLFNIIAIIFMVFIPAITMSCISREKSSDTIELLTTMPVSSMEILLGKFFASLFLIVVGLLITFVHMFTIIILGKNIDYGEIFCAYIAILFLGAVYSAIGLFASTYTKNQIVSFLISFFIIFFFFIINKITIFLPLSLENFFQYISIEYHLSGLLRGVIDSRAVIYFLSLIVVFLKFAEIKLNNNRN